MRLLLDAHVSGPRVGRPLADDGHGVLAVDQDRSFEGMGDEDLLLLAAEESRVVVTFDVGDFAALARRWAADGRSHAGVAAIVGIDTSEFGPILHLLRGVLAERSHHQDWTDVVLFLPRP